MDGELHAGLLGQREAVGQAGVVRAETQQTRHQRTVGAVAPACGGKAAVEPNVRLGGDSNTLIIHNEDTPGCIAEVTMSLAQRRINIASMQVFRAATGGYAVMVLECDSHIPHVLEQQMAVMPGIRKVTCLNIDEPEECEED